MVSKSPKDRVVPLPNAIFLVGLLTTYRSFLEWSSKYRLSLFWIYQESCPEFLSHLGAFGTSSMPTPFFGWVFWPLGSMGRDDGIVTYTRKIPLEIKHLFRPVYHGCCGYGKINISFHTKCGYQMGILILFRTWFNGIPWNSYAEL